MTKKHILIVNDKEKIVQMLSNSLKKAGYLVSHIERGDHAITFIKENPPDLIVMEIMLQDISGVEWYIEARKFSTIPILMIKSSSEKIERLIILESGSGEYIYSPFNSKEIVTYVRAVLKRAGPGKVHQKQNEIVLELNENTHQVFLNDHEILLTNREFDLLKIMLIRPGHIFSRNQLKELLQGCSFKDEHALDTHIKNLRKKIAVFSPAKEIISSVYGFGYKINDMSLSAVRVTAQKGETDKNTVYEGEMQKEM